MSNRQSSIANSQLLVRDLGRMSYEDAYALQKVAQQDEIAARKNPHPDPPPRAALWGRECEMTLFLVEHDPPVITVSRRQTAKQHLVATEEQLRDAGVTVAQTDRGGDITYHGPGQLVVYPILDLNRLGLRLNSYMRYLEQIVIDTLAEFDIEGERDSAATGVWVKGSKICAIGVRISRWVSMHGFALNVSTNLDHFDLIVPCGLAGRSVTSIHKELGDKCPSMEQVKQLVINQFSIAMDDLKCS